MLQVQEWRTLPGMCAAIFPIPVIGIPNAYHILVEEFFYTQSFRYHPSIPVATSRKAINGE